MTQIFREEFPKFELADIIFLTTPEIHRLHSIGVFSLVDLLNCRSDEILLACGNSWKWVESVKKIAAILDQNKIPSSYIPPTDEVVWLGKRTDDKYSFVVVVDHKNTLHIVNEPEISAMDSVLLYNAPITIGTEPLDTNILCWSEFLYQSLWLGRQIDHDYLVSHLIQPSKTKKRFNQECLFIDKPDPSSLTTTIKYIEEIRLILRSLVYWKQDRKSSVSDSSVRRTAKNPPKL